MCFKMLLKWIVGQHEVQRGTDTNIIDITKCSGERIPRKQTGRGRTIHMSYTKQETVHAFRMTKDIHRI